MKKSLALAVIIIYGAIFSAKAQWSLSGNSNATTSSRLGTTNAVPLYVTTNNTVRLYIGQNIGNVGIGTTNPLQKLEVNGNINLAKGYGLFAENHRMLYVDSTRGGVFLGNGAGAQNAATYNTALGYQSFSKNTTGYYNTATGTFALLSNTTGSENVANGAYTLVSNTTGSLNTAVGTTALYNNTVGEKNAAFGHRALFSNTIGWYNTATGGDALYSNTTAYANVANGYRALYSNTGGGGNTAVGTYSLSSNVSGFGNTALGYGALEKNEGVGNTAVGDKSLSSTLNARGNTAVGFQSGYSYTHGYYNTFVGWNANSNQNGLYNTVALGSDALVTAPNQVRIGNSSVTSIGGTAGWSNLSDGRVKRNMKENVPGLAFVNKLKPVTYNLDLDVADKIMGIAEGHDENGKLIAKQLTQTEIAARAVKQKIVYTGFVAQDVEKAAKELGYDFSGVDAAKNEKDLYGLRYSDFVAPLVKAVQELSEENKELKTEIVAMKKELAELKQAIRHGNRNDDFSNTTAFRLEQNTPNPTSNSTRISYSLPSNSHGQIVLRDAAGNTVRTLSINPSGFIDINTESLGSGIYTYSLMVDGKMVATKKLTVVH